MDIENLWEKARAKTEVIRGRIKGLETFDSTKVPYIFLAESVINKGHTIVREGSIIVEKPMILLPEDLPQFEGFEFEKDLDIEQGAMQMFFLMRGIRFPSLKYNNTVNKLDLEELALGESIEKHKRNLEQKENVKTALVIGPEDCWQLSLLIYMASLVGRSAKSDVINLIDKLRKDIT